MNAPDLERQLAATTRLLADLRSEAAAIDASTAENPDDEHDAEGSTIGFERARVAGLLAQVEATASSLQAAVKRQAEGSYGRCESCQREIGQERLEALPASRLCFDCALNAPRG